MEAKLEFLDYLIAKAQADTAGIYPRGVYACSSEEAQYLDTQYAVSHSFLDALRIAKGVMTGDLTREAWDETEKRHNEWLNSEPLA